MNIAKRSQHSFLKRQKEIKRKERVADNMARRHGKAAKASRGTEDEQSTPDIAHEQAGIEPEPNHGKGEDNEDLRR
jgi:hypothetical protein